jgi:hypothetical protein
LITDLNRKEGIKKASDCTCGKSQEKGKCGVEQGKNAIEISAFYLYFLGLIFFNFHLQFNVVQPYLNWVNFTLNIQL